MQESSPFRQYIIKNKIASNKSIWIKYCTVSSRCLEPTLTSMCYTVIFRNWWGRLLANGPVVQTFSGMVSMSASQSVGWTITQHFLHITLCQYYIILPFADFSVWLQSPLKGGIFYVTPLPTYDCMGQRHCIDNLSKIILIFSIPYQKIMDVP